MRPLEIIVVGGGIAGMAYAVRLIELSGTRKCRVRVISKSSVRGSSSYAAQGGIAAAVGEGDSVVRHAEDTMGVGNGRNDASVVSMVVGEGPSVIHWLQTLGARFDSDEQGRLHLAREGGHTTARVVHHLDRTGEEIVRALRERLREADGVELLEGQRAIDLCITEDAGGGRLTGVQCIDAISGDLIEHHADAVVLATGGIGQVYERTTNPAEATGDGIAMALRAGAQVKDMEFVQFHPTALYTGMTGQAPLISEAVRGAGARLLRNDGRPLMTGTHPAGDLAPRNVVARAIQEEMMRSGLPYVMLDTAPIGVVRFAREFPAIERICREQHHAPGRDALPVAPAAHYLCGGIATDVCGRTSLPGLFALGECARTGLHGADRLASNSLLEALVIPRHAAKATLLETRAFGSGGTDRVVASKLSRRSPDAAMRAIAGLRHAMSTHVGVIRNRTGMETAHRLIAHGERALHPMLLRRRWSMALLDLRDLLIVARAVTEAALADTVSVGTHCVVDEV